MEYKLKTDQDKLRTLAEWLDIQDIQKGETEVQKDLRRIADKLTKLEKELQALKDVVKRILLTNILRPEDEEELKTLIK